MLISLCEPLESFSRILVRWTPLQNFQEAVFSKHTTRWECNKRENTKSSNLWTPTFSHLIWRIEKIAVSKVFVYRQLLISFSFKSTFAHYPAIAIRSLTEHRWSNVHLLRSRLTIIRAAIIPLHKLIVRMVAFIR